MIAPGEALAGRYRTTGRLGRGGMAEVWAAHDEVLRREVAVKLFHTTGDAADTRRAVGEMHTLAGLSHPNLVTVFDAGVDGERTFLVMELVAGATLADRIESAGAAGTRGALDPAEVATIAAGVAAGLAYIHQRGIVHRDVKPANVLLPGRGGPPGADVDGPAVKLADFGIAQHAGQERLTQVGTTIGTAFYLSPEQITGRAVGPPSDVYALGVVLLEALGRAPHWAGTPIEIAVARLTSPPEVPADLGAPWTALLTSMTATDPADRPTAAQVRDRLASAATAPLTVATPLTGEATTVLPHVPAGTSTALLPAHEVPPVPDEPRERRRRPVVWGALAAGVAAVAVIGALVLGPSGAADPAPAGDAATTAPATPTDPATPAATPVSATTAPPTTAATTPDPTTAAPTSAAATPGAPAGPGNGNGKAPGQDKTKDKGKPGK